MSRGPYSRTNWNERVDEDDFLEYLDSRFSNMTREEVCDFMVHHAVLSGVVCGLLTGAATQGVMPLLTELAMIPITPITVLPITLRLAMNSEERSQIGRIVYSSNQEELPQWMSTRAAIAFYASSVVGMYLASPSAKTALYYGGIVGGSAGLIVQNYSEEIHNFVENARENGLGSAIGNLSTGFCNRLSAYSQELASQMTEYFRLERPGTRPDNSEEAAVRLLGDHDLEHGHSN